MEREENNMGKEVQEKEKTNNVQNVRNKQSVGTTVLITLFFTLLLIIAVSVVCNAFLK